MKRKNILKFISLLGVGSFVVLAAASCKQPVAEKPTKPTKPADGSGNSTSNPDSGSGDNSGMNSNSGSSGSTETSSDSSDNNNSEMSNNNDVATKEQATSFLNSLTNNELEVYSNGEVANRKDINVDSFEVNKDSIKLKNVGSVPKGWTYNVNLVSNSKNKEEGSIKVKVSLTKDSETISSNDITLSGFRSLKEALASVLFKQQSVKGDDGMMVNKDVLDLGDAKFETLSKLNSNVVIATEGQPAADGVMNTGAGDNSAARSTSRTTLRAEESGTAEASTSSNVATNQDKTTVLNVQFKTLIATEGSEFKSGLENISRTYPDFSIDKLYLTGQAKLVSLFKKNASDWAGSYYLVSKEENNKLTLKLKDKPNWSLEIPGLVIQNLLPDSVKVFVSKIPSKTYSNEELESESNLEAYKTQIEAEKSYTDAGTNGKDKKTDNNKYRLNDNVLSVIPDRITGLSNQPETVTLNPIKVPFVGDNHENDIFFKTQYLFDGKGIFDGDIFASKLLFKKVVNTDTISNSTALRSKNVASIWYGTNFIPGYTEENFMNRLTEVRNKDNNFKIWNKDGELFWKEKSGDNDYLIQGADNSTGNGVAQLIRNEVMNGSEYVTKIYGDKATNFIIFPRISYKKTDSTYGYSWSTTVTILHFEAPNIH
ncbi:hypothetical protein [Mycoplasma bradburyae]|uniref:hypothetical protein n=1 Tax=Mycoplasma bradburyae TaxID=2963128 RepID=UPI00233FD7FB|nr:hypothetical protein [Mycoplasma bradburyae]MDC4184474.1 hypothetical protein [Mycoplasma bradburyae]